MGVPGMGGVAPAAPPEPLTGLAKALKVLLYIWIGLAVVTILNTVQERMLLQDVQDNPFSVSISDLEASDDRTAALAVLALLMLLGTGVVFLVWMNKAYKNLKFFGATTLRRGTGWSVGGWFIPFANLVLPFQTMRDIWVGSDPARADYPTEWWKGGPSAAVVGWWWGLWLLMGATGQMAWRTAPDDFAPIGEYLANNLVHILANLVIVPAAIVAVRLVTQVTQRQQQRAQAVGAQL